ncbi:putative PLP-dependent enzyme possibly involved in cell wall biogenesis [Flammeovirgaceae bacterium 311]|nr:putative PLP-dependent enzyme possibly involved in cell wall biogenesis [Flammeovirgaceae bacterium 311]
MNIPFVDLKSQYISIREEIDTAIRSVVEETAFVGGKYVDDFEYQFAALYGVKHCVPVANGTDAIYIVMKMLGIGPGDEVITTASSWISTSETITQTGAKPVFVDIEPLFYTIDPDRIEEAITPRTRAIIPVHLYGQAAEMDKIMAIAKKNGLAVIEDCAQAHFSEYKGKRTGTIGNAGTFSFYPGKNLGAYGDAGCIITNDDELARKCRLFANHGALKKHQHEIEGINSRLDGLQAAILSAKLPYIHKWTEQRIRNAALYSQLLEGSGLELPLVRAASKHTFHLYVVRSGQRDLLQKTLNEQGIATAIHYPTILPLLPAYNYLNHKPADFPVAYEYQQQILSLPMYPELTEEQIKYVAEVIR